MFMRDLSLFETGAKPELDLEWEATPRPWRAATLASANRLDVGK